MADSDPVRGPEQGATPGLPEGQWEPAEIERRMGYAFSDRGLLLEALTHRSLINEIDEPGRRDNERLEFLGDAVLGFIVAEWLMQAFPEGREGDLTRLRAGLVKEKPLAEAARRLGLGAFLFLGKGEEQMGGRSKRSVLANGFEALTGAVHVDGGLEAARAFVLRHLSVFLDAAQRSPGGALADPKTRVQDLFLTLFRVHPRYEVASQGGPDHAKTFDVVLRFKDGRRDLASGTGPSKKEAEQDAAERFLQELAARPLGLL